MSDNQEAMKRLKWLADFADKKGSARWRAAAMTFRWLACTLR